MLDRYFITYFFVTLFICGSSCKKKEDVTSLPENQRRFYNWEEFVMGADLSYVNAVQDAGGSFRDSGVIKDPYLIFKSHGANTVRLRLWHTTSWQTPYNGGKEYSNLEDVVRSMQRAKSLGLAVCLDFHYSDRWADPGQQQIPVAWQSLNLDALKDSVYQYTFNTLSYLKLKNLVPEMVQIGNEINTGMLFPLGKVVNDNWSSFASLLNSGIRAVRDFSANSVIKPQVIVHVAKLTDADWWAGKIRDNQVTDYDILGISHYFLYSTITSMSSVRNYISNLKQKYNKKIMIMETAYPWTSQAADNYTNVISGSAGFGGYPVNKEGQLQYMKDFTQEVIRGNGSGIIYWEPAWITSGFRDQWGTGSSWENNAFFDFDGSALPVFDYMTHRYQF